MGRPSGLEGFLGLYAEEPDLPHLSESALVFVGDAPYTVREIRRGKKGPQIAFVEVTDRPGAEEIRGRDVFVSARRELDEDEYWPEDLIGLDVRPAGGSVVAVEHGVGQDRLVIARGDEVFEVPFVPELVPVVDIGGGFVEVVEIEGLSSQPDPG